MRSPLQALVVEWLVRPGDAVRAGQPVLLVEAMKMEHALCADADGRLLEQLVAPGEAIAQDQPLWRLDRSPVTHTAPLAPDTLPSATDNAALQALRERLALKEDAARPDAVARRHAQGLRTTDPVEHLMPTLELTAHFHRFAPESEWLLHETVAPVARDGYSSGATRVWGEQGDLLASGMSAVTFRRI